MWQMIPRFVSKYAADIRVWIFLFFLVRLIGISNPPLEVAHNWRQSAVNTIARNFQEIDANIFYPRFDTAGAESGVSGTEFPLLNYLIYLFNGVFGYTHWYGRLINLVVSSLGIHFFYRIIRDHWNERLAFNASMILLTSLWFAFSRKIMPDTFSLSLVLAGVYYGLRYLRSGSALNLCLYLVLIGLGFLAKIPSLTIAAVMILPILDPQILIGRKQRLVMFSIIPVAITAWWYFYWFGHITTGYQLFRMGPGVLEGFKQLIAKPSEMVDNFYFDALKFSGFILFCWGLVQAVLKKAMHVLAVFVSTSEAFLLFMLQAGYGFSMHEYYTLPFVPTMAFIAGYGLTEIPSKRLRIALLAFIMIEGVANQQHDFFVKDKQRYKLTLENFLEQNLDPEHLVVVNGGENPQMMYFAHRRGWSFSSEELLQHERLETLHNDGAHYLIWDKHVSDQKPTALDAIAENDDYAIFDLQGSFE
jgi:4-amino-4-deoxy-L-arabinose transferase-like glycosyltransferase